MAFNPWGVNGQAAVDSTQKPRQQPAPQPAPQQSPTFSTLQKQGVARPPAPQQPRQATVQQMHQALTNAPGGYVRPQVNPQQMISQPPAGMKPGGQQVTHNTNLAPQGGFNLEQWLKQQFTNPAQAPQAKPQQIPMQQALEQLLGGSLQNPSRYGANEAQDLFNRLRGSIDESFDVRRRQTSEEMARRGLGDSTIHGGRLGDLDIQHDRALSDLAGTVATDQARQFANDRAQAIAQALGYGQFATGLGQQQFQNNMATFGAQQGANQQAFQNLFNFGQQQFDNQVTTANLNNQYDQQQIQLLLSLFGMV